MDTFPEFGALVGGPVIPCSDMHQSFTDAIVGIIVLGMRIEFVGIIVLGMRIEFVGIIVLGMRIEFSQQILLSLLSH